MCYSQLPLIWHHFAPEVQKEQDKAMRKHTAAQRRYNQAIKKHAADIAALKAQIDQADVKQEAKLSKKLAALEDNPPAPLPPCPTPRMQSGEVRLLLQLSTALKLLLAPVTTVQDRERGTSLLFDYLVGYKEVRPRT